jgi:hypothetical protein
LTDGAEHSVLADPTVVEDNFRVTRGVADLDIDLECNMARLEVQASPSH